MILRKGIKIIFISLVISFALIMLVLISFKFFVISVSDDLIDLNLTSLKSGESSQIYFLDKDQNFKEYQKVSCTQNRVWVEFSKIPQYMKDVIVAIEDKRFYKHGGVDFIRTAGATLKVLVGKASYGGSSITQQLVKNLTEDSKVTFGRKVREIGRALRLEDRMSKDEILEAYLNIVNFGAGSSGVGSAARIYFDKGIEDCNLAECATIAVITKNPSKYNPFKHPEENKKRREIALKEMLNQNKITESEFEKAMKDSNKLKLSKKFNDKYISKSIRNWYVETLCKEIVDDLCKKYNINRNVAETILYSGGLKIYSCVDPQAQEIAEKSVRSCPPKDKNLELGYTMMDYNGHILATLGSSKPKSANLIYNRAISAIRQPGSVIKPVSVYTPAIDANIFTYSSKIIDEPLDIDIDGSGVKKKWPNNWYKDYKGSVTLQWAIEKSANAPVAQVLNSIGLKKSFKFLTESLNFSHLDSFDSKSYAALATGGTHSGTTAVEVASAYQIFGNGGKFNFPTTYYYVTNKKGNLVLDNRNQSPRQVIKKDTAYVVNRLLRQVIVGKEGTGKNANIENWEIVGKTGTTNNDFDSWFVGLTPACVAAIWTGYDKQQRISDTGFAIRFWKNVMKDYLDILDINHSFDAPDSVKCCAFCTKTGYLANKTCPEKKIGYYCHSNVPPSCYMHTGETVETEPPIDDFEQILRGDRLTN